jgi:hypothetical protein
VSATNIVCMYVWMYGCETKFRKHVCMEYVSVHTYTHIYMYAYTHQSYTPFQIEMSGLSHLYRMYEYMHASHKYMHTYIYTSEPPLQIEMTGLPHLFILRVNICIPYIYTCMHAYIHQDLIYACLTYVHAYTHT